MSFFAKTLSPKIYLQMLILLLFSSFRPLFRCTSIIQTLCPTSYKTYKNPPNITQPKMFFFSFTFSARNILNKYKENSNSRSVLRERNASLYTHTSVYVFTINWNVSHYALGNFAFTQWARRRRRQIKFHSKALFPFLFCLDGQFVIMTQLLEIIEIHLHALALRVFIRSSGLLHNTEFVFVYS